MLKTHVSWAGFQFPFLFYFLLCLLDSAVRIHNQRSRWLGRHLFPFEADLFLYFYLCVSRLLCQIIMFCSHSASSPFRSIAVTLCFVKNNPVWSGRVLSSVWTYLCPVSQLSRPVVRLPPGTALRTVLPSVEVAARHSGRDRTSSRSSQVCYCVPVFPCSVYA